jgi:histidinol-phosphate aminotransferase
MQGVIVRALTAYGYPQHIRVTVGQHEENVRFIEALKNVI